MEQCWRWFGPDDPVTLSDVRQAGATGIVTALHDQPANLPHGQVWPDEAIAARKSMIEAAGLRWSVVESIPVPEAIKLGGADARPAIEVFKGTMAALARNGLRVICYNFMPVVDWTRTALRHPMPSGGLALHFDMIEFAAYDLFVLERPGAASQWSEDIADRARAWLATRTPEQIEELERTIIAGLPGSDFTQDRATMRSLLARYNGIDAPALRANLIAFQQAIVPLAHELGLRMCIHPDDPPFPLFGLPRVVSTPSDLDAIFAATPDPANGLTFCAGSLGSRADNDLTAMMRRHAERVHFVHLRNVSTLADGSFTEDDHLRGNADFVALTAILLAEEARRRAVGREDVDIPFRPDHGHLLLDDQAKRTNPGYSAIGRLKGLAEIRGIIAALSHPAVRVDWR